MAENITYPSNVFVSLQELLKMEHLARGFSFRAKKQKVRSILGGKHASKLRGRGLDFEEVRNYVAGDDIRNIDWKVTARTQQTHTRVFSEEKEKPALIIVDQTKSMFFGSQKNTKAVVAAQLAAIAAFRVQKEGDRVGGIVLGDKETDIIFPKRDRKNILHFLEKLVKRNHELKDSKAVDFEPTLDKLLAKVNNIVTHDFLVIIISDFHRYNPEVVKFISRIAQHNDVMLAKVYDPFEQQGPEMKVIVGDKEKQLVVDGSDKKLRKQISDAFQSEFENFRGQMKKHRIPVLLVDTVQEVDVQLKNILTGKAK